MRSVSLVERKEKESPKATPIIMFLFFYELFCGLPWAYCQGGSAHSMDGPGPFPIINQAPTLLPFLQPPPDRAATLRRQAFSLRLNTTLTNTLVSQSSDHYSGIVDMETIRLVAQFQLGITDTLELGATLPLSYSYGGVLDNSILLVERAFGEPRGVRDAETRNQYAFDVKKDGRTFLGGSMTSSGFGDPVFSAKLNIKKEDAFLPCFSTRFSLKAPVGDRARALGSGQADIAVGFLLQKSIDRLTSFLNADMVFPGQAYRDMGISLRNYSIVMLGIQYSITDSFSLACQFRYTSRPFDGTGLEMLDRRIHDITLGVTYTNHSGFFIQAGGVEDLRDSTEAGADITFFLSAGKIFN